MPKKRSSVWEHFILKEVDGKKKVICNLCNSALSYMGGTSCMKNHLQARHPAALGTDNLGKEGSGGARMIGATADMRNFVKTGGPKMSQQRYALINQKLAEMCAIDYRPISIVNGKGFKSLIATLEPSYVVPSHTTIRNYVHRSYVEAKDTMLKVIESQNCIALTTDMWTSHATQGYITLTSHYINDNWQLRSQILATRNVSDRHTGENIAQAIKGITEEFNIKEVSCITHENAANMDLAMCIYGSPHIGCAGHTLQLSIQDGLKVPEITKSIARCRNIVSFFHRSVLASEALVKAQKDGEPGKGLTFIQDVATRWNSTYLMLERLVRLRIPLYAVLYDRAIIKEKDAKILELSDNDWSVAEHLTMILKPLQIATQTMSGEYYPTLGNVYPIIIMLVTNHLKDPESDTDHNYVPESVKKCRTAIRQSLERRFKVGQEDILGLTATALNSMHKKLTMFSIDQKEQVKSFLKAEVSKLRDQRETTQTETVDKSQDPKIKEEFPEPEAKRLKSEHESSMKFLMGNFYIIDSDDEEDEVEAYFSEKRSNTEPLQWWKVNQHRYPNLKVLAQRFLAIPATSTPSERVFSSAGNTVVPNRASLDSGTVDELVFLHSALTSKGNAQLTNISTSGVTDPSLNTRYVTLKQIFIQRLTAVKIYH